MNKRVLFMPILCGLFLVSCAHQFAGTGSEVEGMVIGKVVYNDGEPVAGAKVRIRPNGYLAFNREHFFAFDTTTDNGGYFCFDTLVADSYTVEINKDGIYGALKQLLISATDTFPIKLPIDTVVLTGSIIGRINLPITDDTCRPLIALYDVDYMAKAMVTQDFRFDGVPPGTYHLRIVPFLASKLVMELYDINVVCDSVVDVGTLNLVIQQFFKGCGSWQCDSLAVGSILDANGLANVAVGDVATTDSATGRVIALDLSGRSLKTVAKDIGSLSALKVLDLRNNRIGSLPEYIGYLRSMEECFVDGNELYELPCEFGYLGSLRVLTASNNSLYQIGSELMELPLVKLDLRENMLEYLPEAFEMLPYIDYLYLDDNMLQSLPDAITQIRPKEFSASRNRLCDTTGAYAQWMTFYDKDWRASQDCK